MRRLVYQGVSASYLLLTVPAAYMYLTYGLVETESWKWETAIYVDKATLQLMMLSYSTGRAQGSEQLQEQVCTDVREERFRSLIEPQQQ